MSSFRKFRNFWQNGKCYSRGFRLLRKFLQMLSAFHHNKILDLLNVKQVIRNFLGKFPENPKIVKFAKCKPLTGKFRGENHIKQKFWVNNVSFLIGCWFDFISKSKFLAQWFVIGSLPKFKPQFFTKAQRPRCLLLFLFKRLTFCPTKKERRFVYGLYQDRDFNLFKINILI